MAVNLATKYSDQLAKAFAAESFLTGKVAENYEFTGVKALKVYTPQTVDLVDYTRGGSNRYGEPQEMQDLVQELIVSQDKAFALTIDKGNSGEQMDVKRAGEMLALQIKEKVVPAVEKHAYSQFIKGAGQTIIVSAEPTKENIVELISKASEKLDDALVPSSERYLHVTPAIYSAIRLASEFITIDKLGEKAISKGVVGEIFGAKVVKVPTSYLPANCYFLLMHKSAGISPTKISEAKIHKDPPGISGDLLEGRYNYDSFMMGARANGACILVKDGEQQVAPTVTVSSDSITIAATGADTILYTVDGGDPRYFGGKIYTGPIAVDGLNATERVVKAVAYKNGKFTSNVTMKTLD